MANSAGVAEEEVEKLALDAEIDKVLDEKAAKNNLSAKNVKSIIYQVISNKLVKKMYLNTIRREKRQKANCENGLDDDDEDYLLYEPKLTRSRTKELFSKKSPSSTSLLNSSEEKSDGDGNSLAVSSSPLKCQNQSLDNEEESHIAALLLKDLPEGEDSEDDEYIPSKLDTSQMSDEECNSSVASFASDIGSPAPVAGSSQANNPSQSSTPKRRSRKRLIVEGMEGAKIVKSINDDFDRDMVFKTPDIPVGKSKKCIEQEEDLAIGLRTRSKLPLNDMPLEHFESQFIPPDITMDMYDYWDGGDAPENAEYFKFLKSTYYSGNFGPANLEDTLRNADEDEEDGDPEYNVMEDEDEDHDKEELRDDRAVKIPKKELQELVSEMCESFPLWGNDGGVNLEEMLGLRNPGTVDNVPPQNILPQIHNQAQECVSVSDVTKPDCITKSSEPLQLCNNRQEAKNTNTSADITVTLETVKQEDCSKINNENLCVSAKNPLHVPTENNPLISDMRLPVVDMNMNQNQNTAQCETSVFSAAQMNQLQDQMQKHLQLLTQTFFLNVSTDKRTATQAKELIDDTWRYSCVSGPNSAFSVCNLKPAVIDTDNWERNRLKTPIKKKILEQRIINGEAQYSMNGFPRSVVRAMIESPAICYPELVPKRIGTQLPGSTSENDSSDSGVIIPGKNYWSKSEDAILIYELDFIKHLGLNIPRQAEFLAKNLPLNRTVLQIYHRIRNMHKSKYRMFQDYKRTGILPRMEDDVFLRPDEPMTLASKPICRIPKLWRKLIHEARQPVITITIPDAQFVEVLDKTEMKEEVPSIQTTQIVGQLVTRRREEVKEVLKEKVKEVEKEVDSCARTRPFEHRKTNKLSEALNFKRIIDMFAGSEYISSDCEDDKNDDYKPDPTNEDDKEIEYIDLCIDTDPPSSESDNEIESHISSSTLHSPSSSCISNVTESSDEIDLNVPCHQAKFVQGGEKTEKPTKSKSEDCGKKKNENDTQKSKGTCSKPASSSNQSLRAVGEGGDDDDDPRKKPASNRKNKDYDTNDTDSQHEEPDDGDETDDLDLVEAKKSTKTPIITEDKKPQHRKRKRSKPSPNARLTRKSFKYNTAPIENLLESTEIASNCKNKSDEEQHSNNEISSEWQSVAEDIQSAFVEAYNNRVRQKIEVEGKNPGLYSSFIQLLQDFENSDNMSQKELFLKVERLLKDYPGLVKQFTGILDADVASELGYFADHLQERTYLHFMELIEKWTEKCPQLKARVLHKCRVLREDRNLTKEKVVSVIDTYLDQNPLLIEAFQSMFPTFFRPDLISSPADFEEIELEMEEKPSTSSTSNSTEKCVEDESKVINDIDYEIVKLPEEPNPVASSSCPCSCHETQTNTQYRNRVKHCTKCCLKFQDGKIFGHSGRVMKPVSVRYTSSENAEKIMKGDTCITCLKPKASPTSTSSTSVSRVTSVTSSITCDLTKENSTASHSHSIYTPAISAVSVTSSANSTATYDPAAAVPSTSKESQIIPIPIEGTSKDSNTLPVSVIANGKPVTSSSIQKPWTKDEDRIILTTWQGESSWSTTLTRLQAMMPKRSRVEIKERTMYLMKLLEKVTKT